MAIKALGQLHVDS